MKLKDLGGGWARSPSLLPEFGAGVSIGASCKYILYLLFGPGWAVATVGAVVTAWLFLVGRGHGERVRREMRVLSWSQRVAMALVGTVIVLVPLGKDGAWGMAVGFFAFGVGAALTSWAWARRHSRAPEDSRPA